MKRSHLLQQQIIDLNHYVSSGSRCSTVIHPRRHKSRDMFRNRNSSSLCCCRSLSLSLSLSLGKGQ